MNHPRLVALARDPMPLDSGDQSRYHRPDSPSLFEVLPGSWFETLGTGQPSGSAPFSPQIRVRVTSRVSRSTPPRISGLENRVPPFAMGPHLRCFRDPLLCVGRKTDLTTWAPFLRLLLCLPSEDFRFHSQGPCCGPWWRGRLARVAQCPLTDTNSCL